MAVVFAALAATLLIPDGWPRTLLILAICAVYLVALKAEQAQNNASSGPA